MLRRSMIAILLPPALLLLLALAFRLVNFDQESYFIDEVLTLEGARGPVLRHCMEKEANPPLYFLLASGWIRLAGGDMPLRAIRLLSVLAGALTAPLLDPAAQALSARWHALPGARAHINFPHIQLWEINNP